MPSVERVLLTETGSEATFHALRVARAATGRRHVLKFQGCYHGWHDSVAMNVISPPSAWARRIRSRRAMLPEVIDATIVCRFNDADEVERALDDHDVAAIILEPIPHNIGAVLPQPGFLERLRELATTHGTVLIFDEVITGFRHALGGYQSIAGVTPDLTTMGKAMGNGWPVSALGGKAELMELFSTTPGNPVVLRRHVQRPPADRRRGARDDRQAAARARARARVPARRACAAGAARAVRAARRAGRRQRLRLGLRHLLPRRRR